MISFKQMVNFPGALYLKQGSNQISVLPFHLSIHWQYTHSRIIFFFLYIIKCIRNFCDLLNKGKTGLKGNGSEQLNLMTKSQIYYWKSIIGASDNFSDWIGEDVVEKNHMKIQNDTWVTQLYHKSPRKIHNYNYTKTSWKVVSNQFI